MLLGLHKISSWEVVRNGQISYKFWIKAIRNIDLDMRCEEKEEPGIITVFFLK